MSPNLFKKSNIEMVVVNIENNHHIASTEHQDKQIQEKLFEISNRLDASVDQATVAIDKYSSAKLLSKNYLKQKSIEPELKNRQPKEFDGSQKLKNFQYDVVTND